MGTTREFRRLGWVVALVCGYSVAQQPVPVLTALQNAKLTVWVIEPAANAPNPARLQQQAASTFGQSASTFGTSAGNVGISPSSPLISRVGPIAANVAPGDRDAAVAAAAGYREQTAGSFGASAGSAGTAASDFGQTAASCGQSASTFGQSAASYGVGLSALRPPSHMRAGNVPPWRVSIEPRLRSDYPRLQVRFIEITSDKLDDALRTTIAGSMLYPDVLVFDGIPASWLPPGVKGCNARRVEAEEKESGLPARRYLALNGSPHAETARAFLEYLDELNHAR